MSTIHPYNPDTTACTGGFTSSVFASIACINPAEKGQNRSGQFLYGADTAGYCLDAQDLLPAGSCHWDDFKAAPAASFTVR